MLQLWEASTGLVLLTIEGHSKDITGFSINEVGSLLVTSSLDHTCVVRVDVLLYVCELRVLNIIRINVYVIVS